MTSSAPAKKSQKLEELYKKVVRSGNFSPFLNITNKDVFACEVLCSLGGIKEMLHLIESQLAQGIYSKTTNAAVDILYNISKNDSCFRYFEEEQVLHRCFPLMKATDIDLKTTTAMMLANLVKKEEDFSLLQSDKDVLNFMLLQITTGNTGYDTCFSEAEVIMGLQRLSVNDQNKLLICQNSQVLQRLCKIVEKGAQKKQNTPALLFTLGTLFNLAFQNDNKQVIKSLPSLLENLKALTQSTDFTVCKSSKGILYLLNELVFEHEEANGTSGFDVMISYNWNEQTRAVKLKELLKKRGLKVWIDLEQMGGSTLEAMANAIDQSAVILLCFSQKYKESPNCRMEAEYTLQQRKTFIPLRFQDSYAPDGWLGMAIGSKLWFDFSKVELYERSAEGLLKELERRGSLNIAARPPSTINLLPAPGDVADPPSWKEADVAQWLEKTSFAQLQESFKREAMDGRSLHQLHRLLNSAAEFFYKSLKEEFGLEKFGDRLRFADELHKLFE